MATYLEIQQQIKALQEQAEELRKAEMATVIAEIKEKITTYGISAKDLGFPEAPVRVRRSKEEAGEM